MTGRFLQTGSWSPPDRFRPPVGSDGTPRGSVVPRRPGAGRKKLTETDSGLRSALLRLMEPEGILDPPLRWTTRSTRSLAEALRACGHPASAWTVARLLHEASFRLPGRIRPGSSSAAEAQLRIVCDQVSAWLAAGRPAVAVDVRPGPDAAADRHAEAMAVSLIGDWWRETGQRGGHLLVIADTGAGNPRRSLRQSLGRFATETATSLTVCHLPPVTMRWSTGHVHAESQLRLGSPAGAAGWRDVRLHVLSEPGPGTPADALPDLPGSSRLNYAIEPGPRRAGTTAR